MRGGADGGASPRPALLAADEPPAVLRENGAATGCGVVTCDHASNRIPRALDGLGLPVEALDAHIAWDIGAAAVASRIAVALDLPLLRTAWSRLVADCNRTPRGRGCLPPLSDGRLVPGNLGLDDAARAARIDTFHRPYHDAIGAELERRGHDGRVPAVISVHSFTPRMHGLLREWHVGVLWDSDPRLPIPLMEALRAERGLRVGDNLPYSGRHPDDYTVDLHGEAAGRPYVSIELRQDLVADETGQAEWAARLVHALAPVLADPALYTRWPGAKAGRTA